MSPGNFLIATLCAFSLWVRCYSQFAESPCANPTKDAPGYSSNEQEPGAYPSFPSFLVTEIRHLMDSVENVLDQLSSYLRGMLDKLHGWFATLHQVRLYLWEGQNAKLQSSQHACDTSCLQHHHKEVLTE